MITSRLLSTFICSVLSYCRFLFLFELHFSANIQAGTLGNFQKLSFSDVTLYDIPYDLGSVMHYAPTVRKLSQNANKMIGDNVFSVVL